MKTTLNLDDRLIAEAKAVAAKERSTLTRLIEEGLALRLRRKDSRARRALAELPVYEGRGGLQPGIDPSSNQSLYEAAEQA
jgi:hypothetical protein